MGKFIFGSFGKIDDKLIKFVNRLIYAAITTIILSLGSVVLAITVEPVKRQAEDEKLSIRIDYNEKELESKAPMAVVQYGINLLEDELKSRKKTEEQNDTIIKYLKRGYGNR